MLVKPSKVMASYEAERLSSAACEGWRSQP